MPDRLDAPVEHREQRSLAALVHRVLPGWSVMSAAARESRSRSGSPSSAKIVTPAISSAVTIGGVPRDQHEGNATCPLDLAARELVEVSARLQAAATALRESI